jgi:hypothetical protein
MCFPRSRAPRCTYDEHRTYVGMTPAYLHTWGGARRIAVRRATKSTYCIESTARGPKVHDDGPHGPAQKARAAFAAPSFLHHGGRRRPRPLTPTSPPRWAAELGRHTARADYADHNTYAGATVEKLRRYDAGFRDVTVAWARRDRFSGNR